jgi:single-strand DNA-binding protein
MASFNKVFLIGNLTRDPVLRHTPNGAAVTELGVACNRTYTTKDGQSRDEVTFIDVTVWNRQAETCCEYLKKGRPVHVEGFLKMDTWDDKTTGEKRSKLKVEAERVQFLGSGGGGGTDDTDDGGGNARDSAPAPRRAEAPQARGYSNGPPRGGSPPAAQPRRPAPEPEPTHDDDEDIPF